MASILITAASGQLGQLIVQELLASGIAPSQLAVAVRTPSKVASWAEQGISVRQADYADEPDVWAKALAGIQRLLLISSSDMSTADARINGQLNVVRAAKSAGVGFIAYTSILHAPTNTMKLAHDHVKTEEAIKESGAQWVFLRNGWYTENYTQAAPSWREHGIAGVAPGKTIVNAASRADYAAAAALAIRPDSSIPANTALELAGDEDLTLDQLAQIASKKAGVEIKYSALPEQVYAGILKTIGLPPLVADILADADAKAGSDGELRDDSHTLSKIIGRKTTPVEETVDAALA